MSEQLSRQDREAIREAICFALMEQPPNVEEERHGAEMGASKVRLDLSVLPQLAGWPRVAIEETLACLDDRYLSDVAGRPVARLVMETTTVVI